MASGIDQVATAVSGSQVLLNRPDRGRAPSYGGAHESPVVHMTDTRIAAAELLSPIEENLWRATMRVLTALPSRLDADLVRGVGLTGSEYATLKNLSDTPNHELRMTDLAKSTGLSASRTTRLVDDLRERGLPAKVASSADARSTL